MHNTISVAIRQEGQEERKGTRDRTMIIRCDMRSEGQKQIAIASGFIGDITWSLHGIYPSVERSAELFAYIIKVDSLHGYRSEIATQMQCIHKALKSTM